MQDTLKVESAAFVLRIVLTRRYTGWRAHSRRRTHCASHIHRFEQPLTAQSGHSLSLPGRGLG